MSRIIILTKNYLKLIFRAKSVLIITVIGALVVMAALTNVFHTLLDQAETNEDFTIGYEMDEDSRYILVEEYLIEGFEEAGMTVIEYTDADPDALIRDEKIDVFIDFEGDSYSIKGRSNDEIDARIVQYVLYNVDHMINGDTGKIEISSGKIEARKQADADTYYTIVQTVYFSSLCSAFLCLVYISERKQNIGIRFRSSTAGGARIYLAKLFSCTLTSWLVMALITGGLAIFLFDLKLGSPLMIGSLFMVLWIAGYVGGTFETYMLSSVPDSVQELSPLYYVNRTLVELSVNGQSDYLGRCLMVLSIMSTASIALGMFVTSRKKGV